MFSYTVFFLRPPPDAFARRVCVKALEGFVDSGRRLKEVALIVLSIFLIFEIKRKEPMSIHGMQRQQVDIS